MATFDQKRYRYLQFTGNSIYRRFLKNEFSKAGQTENEVKEPITDGPTHGTYGALLFHAKWKERRKEILRRDNHQCVNCKSEKELQVHHRQYHFVANQNQFRLPWEYPDQLLITLCESCHNRGHSKYKVPTITI